MNKISSLTRLSVCLIAAGFSGGAFAAEISGQATTTGKPMSKNLGPVTQQMLNASAGDKNQWLHPNANYEQTRFHPASQINTSNVSKLCPAFIV